MQQSLQMTVATERDDTRVIGNDALEWFTTRYGPPSEMQLAAWRAWKDKRSFVVSAPTGSGKTLAGFFAAIEELGKVAEAGQLEDRIYILYISPLKALVHDIEVNLREPLRAICPSGVRSAVRSGDTTASERARMLRNPPHILATTPESLFLLLTAEKSSAMMQGVEAVIIDELGAIAGDKRGAHLALSLARLDQLSSRKPVRVGLSATIKPIESVLPLLHPQSEVEVIEEKSVKRVEAQIELPSTPLAAITSQNHWAEIHARILELHQSHRTLLVFTNNRRAVERLARALSELLDPSLVGAHHGSMSRTTRLDAEERLRNGTIRIMVATASLELGIDIGTIDAVIQIGGCTSINTLLQRTGRCGRGPGATSRMYFFPLTRDQLAEAIVGIKALHDGSLEPTPLAKPSRDVLAQQLVAIASSLESIDVDELFALIRTAAPYRSLSRDTFEEILEFLDHGMPSGRTGRRSGLLRFDRTRNEVRTRRGTRLKALTNAGVIPDQFEFDVVCQPNGDRIGSVNEDFAIESLPGQIFQLGNTSYRILQVRRSTMHVEQAGSLPPTIPFWFGDGPSRTPELSQLIADLREEVSSRYQKARTAQSTQDAVGDIADWIADTYAVGADAARQLAIYLTSCVEALGGLPTMRHIYFERFFDDVGDQHLVVHSPFGARINRSWALAMRKKFCLQFNFELQASAVDNAFMLSLSPVHSFELTAPSRYLHPETLREVLEQAILDAPVFLSRWRWVAQNALIVLRRSPQKRPPIFLRAEAEDLLAQIFPDQLACLENIRGDRDIPEHPLVGQALYDCLDVFMDTDGLAGILNEIKSNDIAITGIELNAASPLAEEMIHAKPYAFLDDAGLDERRSRNISTPSASDVNHGVFSQFHQLDSRVIADIQASLFKNIVDDQDLRDALLAYGYLTRSEIEGLNATALAEQLLANGEAQWLNRGKHPWLVALERIPTINCALDLGTAPAEAAATQPEPNTLDPDQALAQLMEMRLDCQSPIKAANLAHSLGVSALRIQTAAAILINTGSVFNIGSEQNPVFCSRHLLFRFRQGSLRAARAAIQPITPAVYLRALAQRRSSVQPASEITVQQLLSRLELWSAPAASWNSDIFSHHLTGFKPEHLDALTAKGSVRLLRLSPTLATGTGSYQKKQHTPLALVQRQNYALATKLASQPDQHQISGEGQQVHSYLQEYGASFYEDIAIALDLPQEFLHRAIGELLFTGVAYADNFSSYSHQPRKHRQSKLSPIGGRIALRHIGDANRDVDHADLEQVIHILLNRWGVLCAPFLQLESKQLPRWQQLLPILRQMEMRGDLRSGRFIDLPLGEQFSSHQFVDELQTASGTTASAIDEITGSHHPEVVMRTLLTKLESRKGVATST